MLQPEGGFLEVEPALAAHVALATAAGAELRTGEAVRAIEPRDGHVGILTDHGTIEAGTVIIAMGAWTKSLLPALPLAAVTREVIGLVRADRRRSVRGRPVASVHHREPARHALRHPATRRRRREGRQASSPRPDRRSRLVDRTVSAADERRIRAAIAEHIPAANGRLLEAKTCLYTMTPDGDFLIDRLPGQANIIVASPCSGHGFKFAPAIGEILADLATTGATRHDIARFRLGRFG